ncbi:hypothetical protein VTN96DRAFT_2039 [Rasamsonia emersonii]|uniref:RNase III domain protein n=1 Tax=Rasamsonia emersonii (strain ATCC 16479 / CBS 393.64 / IMI 116815) TaxID=1408163 RepID=A0A0F4YUB2_RASE3|nr:RNase III domain protein [Rasamsonia emersonii CBS 393.64]KKA21824.1 RNase III domain protein [Rasamsonia emersonii CBS 393.64]
MASKLPARSFRAVSSSVRPRSTCLRASNLSTAVSQRRVLSTESSLESTQANETAKPRWSYTPPGAKAPFRLRYNPNRPEFPVNEDPAVLDQFYIRFLGNGGDKLLSEEIKWLAVTHKSFDQGRRGFNDRLAFLGKRIVQLQASLALVQDAGNFARKVPEDPHGRQPFTHPALDGLNNLSSNTKGFLTSKIKLSELAQKYDLQKVVRWCPRMPNDLRASGIDVVLAHTMYAIIGAIALEKGGLVANKVAQERILAPLGLKSTIS